MNIQVCRSNLKHVRKPLKSQLINWSEIIQPDKFDFDLVKFDLQKLNSNTAKKAYLIEIKADFLQSENICSIAANKSFAYNIDIELAKIEEIEKLPSGNEANCLAIASEKNGTKPRINGNTNIFVDFFYRMLYEFKPEGKPFLDGTPTDIARIIVENFVNREGKNISLSSVKSTLSPSKIEKRPTCDKRFCMRHLDTP